MELTEKLAALATKIQSHGEVIETEEATKNAFVMPFVATVLGYDVFDPTEVIPEFTADVGTKRGEKIDYAIVNNGIVQILIECKPSHGELSLEHASQLFRYFSVTNARIAALTNGVVWQFYTDLDTPNRMDSKPFLVLDLLDIDETLIPEVQKFTKTHFDLDSVINAAEELKYVGALKREIGAQFREPSEEWVRFFTTRVYDRSFTAKVREQFTPLVDKAARQFLTEQVNDRLKTALGADAGITTAPPTAATVEADSATNGEDSENAGTDHPEIVTTIEEIEGFQIVKAIACSEVKPSRVAKRDQKSYFAVLLDDNNRRPIARLHFNSRQKYLGLLDENKVETRHPIETVDEIYRFAEDIRAAVVRYQ